MAAYTAVPSDRTIDAGDADLSAGVFALQGNGWSGQIADPASPGLHYRYTTSPFYQSDIYTYALWNFTGVAAGVYEVLATWPGNLANTTSAEYYVSCGNGTAVPTSQTRRPPQRGGRRQLADSGQYTVANGQVMVTLWNNSSAGQLAAEAVMLVPVSTTRYSYDPNGNLTSTTDPDGHTTWTVYDALNRAVKTVSARAAAGTRYSGSRHALRHDNRVRCRRQRQ